MGQFTIFSDPDTGLKTREGIRGGSYVVDTELTSTGFLGTENIDWENVKILPIV